MHILPQVVTTKNAFPFAFMPAAALRFGIKSFMGSHTYKDESLRFVLLPPFASYLWVEVAPVDRLRRFSARFPAFSRRNTYP